jgi:hypothetical protein
MATISDSTLPGVTGAMNIGFDMIMGPMLRWMKNLDADGLLSLDYDQFAMTAYLAFKGGNDGGPRPQAIIYDSFSVVGFQKGMDLVCIFLKNQQGLEDIPRLHAFADEISASMEQDDSDGPAGAWKGVTSSGENVDEVKRIVCNMLRKNEVPTPEIRKQFNLTSSEIWSVMGDLEHDGLVKRVGTKGRAVVWTLT